MLDMNYCVFGVLLEDQGGDAQLMLVKNFEGKDLYGTWNYKYSW